MSNSSSEELLSENKSRTVCHLCRQRKTKCDRALPQCGFCLKAKVECQYVSKQRKRGLRAGYVSELENRIEHLEKKFDSLKDEQVSLVAQTPVSPATVVIVGTTPSSIRSSTTHLSLQSQSPSKRKRFNVDSNAAVTDLMSLPAGYLQSLTEMWFKETQPWCPILDRQHIQSAVEALPHPVDHIEDIELKAVLCMKIAYSTQAIYLGYHGRERLSQHLRSQVLSEALSNPCLSSLRALLIIALLDYGTDNIPSTFSILSVCRRTCEHIGLFRKLLSQIELESPTAVGPPSRDHSSGDEELAIPLTWSILALDAVSSLGCRIREHSRSKRLNKTHTHLAAIGLQPVHTFIHDCAMSEHVVADENTLARCDEMYQNLMNYVQSQPKTSYTLLANGLIDFDPNLAHTAIVAHASAILIYQRLVNFEEFLTDVPLQRCLQACEDLVMDIRSMSDTDAEFNTPLLSHFFFVAARFKLIACRNMGQPREASFDTLMHGINMNGRRWTVARRLDLVLRAAVAEVDNGAVTPLPDGFWNLKMSHLDISESLKEWIREYKPSLYVSSLNGPYI